MRKVEIYTIEDARRDLDRGDSDSEVALRKWESILDALRAVEEVAVQMTSFCLKYMDRGCQGCPILNYDYPCGHPYASFTLFYQELRKLRMISENLYAILMAVYRDDMDARKNFV